MNTSVLIPGPSWIENRWMSKTRPIRLFFSSTLSPISLNPPRHLGRLPKPDIGPTETVQVLESELFRSSYDVVLNVSMKLSEERAVTCNSDDEI